MSNKRFDVAIVGNVGVDTNIYIAGRDINLDVESNFTENLDCVGQAGGYSARGFAQLGKRTAFIGYIGDDFQGRLIREEFERDGIDTTCVFIDPSGTCRSVNLMYPDGRRRNFYDGKDHMQLHPNIECCKVILADVRLVHFNIPNWARYLLPLAREAGATVSCDLQDVMSLVDSYRDDFVKNADILFFSAVNQPSPSSVLKKSLPFHNVFG
jgi:acarbose 7IV-phosphotransferase